MPNLSFQVSVLLSEQLVSPIHIYTTYNFLPAKS